MKKINYIIIIAILFFIILNIFSNNNDINIEYKYIEMPKLYVYNEYPNISELHYSKMPITYSINVSSGNNYWVDDMNRTRTTYGVGRLNKINKIYEAIEIIENKTDGLIYFEEKPYGEDVNLEFIGLSEQKFLEIFPEYSPYIILPSGSYPEFRGNTYTAGLAKPVEIDYDNNIIKKYQIYFTPQYVDTYEKTYYSWIVGTCQNFPSTEIHEILHTFAFDHINDAESIMNPIQDDNPCKIKSLDEKTIYCLKYIYSNGIFDGNCDFPNFIHEKEIKNEYYCDDGWYPAIGENLCCPEPDMYIGYDGYCT